jgi:UDP-2-acetamido-2-deoxy-ribo-hexuluronate aminotransferase
VGGRLDTLQAAVLLAKLKRFDWELQRRSVHGARYDALLAGWPGLQRVAVRPDRNSVYAQYTVRVARRAEVLAALQAEGVPTAVHYPRALHQQPAYERFAPPGGCPVSEALAASVMSLPMSADLCPDDQDRVVQALSRAVGRRPVALAPGP